MSARLCTLTVLSLFVVSCGGDDLPTEPETAVATTVDLSSSSLSFTSLGANEQVTATVKDQNAVLMSGAVVTWSSSDATVATVSSTGVVTAVADGTATITATSGSASGSISVTVEQVAATIEVSPGSLAFVSIGTSETFSATVKDAGGTAISGAVVTWSSSDATVATVSSTGVVTTVASGTATITATSGSATGSATVTLQLFWPMPGSYGADWVINNYVDLDQGPGILDYEGGAKSYDGHNGIDIDVPNFRWMDADFPVIAAADGVVTQVRESEPDRNVVCGAGTLNLVELLHAGGTSAVYGHLKRASVVVAVGDEVRVGDTLGVVGSSGCSTAPHLHFELRDKFNAVVDPFRDRLWVDTPSYNAPLTFMDGWLKDGAITTVNELKDPSPNVTSIAVGSLLSIGLSMAGGTTGDQINVTFEGGSGVQVYNILLTFGIHPRHTYWIWNRFITNDPGVWRIRIYTNGKLARTYEVTVQ